MKIKIMLLILALLASVQITEAAGTGVSPGNFTFKLAPGASENQLLTVFNMGTESASFSVSKSPSNVSNWITLSPSTSFELEGKKTKEILVKITAPPSATTGGKCNLKIIGTSGGILNIAISVPVSVLVLDSDSSSGDLSGGFSKRSEGGGEGLESVRKTPNFSLFTITGKIKNKEVISPVLNDIPLESLGNETHQLGNETTNKTNKSSLVAGFDALFAGASFGILGLLLKR
jgi:hypothetical protein